MKRKALIALATAAGLAAAPAIAAENAQDPAREIDTPKHFDSQAKPQSNETLTERLDRTDGVIKPPASASPKLQVIPPPKTGDTELVIPPPPAGEKPPAEK